MNSNQLSRRRFLQYTAGVAGVAALAACAPSAAPSGGSSGAPDAEVKTVSLGLTWAAEFQPTQAKFNEEFSQRNPDIEVDVVYNTWADHNNVVPTWAAANTLPDIVYVHGSRGFPWSFEGIVVNIQDYVDSDEAFNVEGIWAEALNLYKFKGNQHAIPYDHGPVLLGYNKDIFDAAGMSYPDETWTMDDMRAAALELSTPDADVPKWGFHSEYPVTRNEGGVSCLGPWGGELLNEDESALVLDSEAAHTALQYWADMIHVDKSAPTPAQSQAFEQGAWIAGQAAMHPTPSWETPGLAQFASFAWDVAPWPTGPAGAVTGSFGSGFGITKNSENPDQAWTFLSEYLSKEGMEFMWGSTGRGSPARKDAYPSWINSPDAPANAQAYLDALDTYAVTGRPYQTLAAAELIDIMNRQTDLLKSGEIDVDAAIAAIVEDGTPVLEEATARLNA